MTPNSPHPAECSWPVRLYLGALAFAFLSLVFLTPALDGPRMNAARVSSQLAICGVMGLRLAWAMHRREQSKAWILYVAGMVFAVPIWMLVEPLIKSLGK